MENPLLTAKLSGPKCMNDLNYQESQSLKLMSGIRLPLN
jgi:hypothetical protein